MRDTLVLVAVALVLVLAVACVLLEHWMQRRAAEDAGRMFPDMRWRDEE